MAARLGISERRVRKLAAEGRLVPATKVHRSWIFTPQTTLIRPPERWNRGPAKIPGEFEGIPVTSPKLMQHFRYWLDNPTQSG